VLSTDGWKPPENKRAKDKWRAYYKYRHCRKTYRRHITAGRKGWPKVTLRFESMLSPSAAEIKSKV
jgi:hypothetical protein